MTGSRWWWTSGDGVQRFDIRATKAGRRGRGGDLPWRRGGDRGHPVGARRAHGPFHGGPGRRRGRTPRRGHRTLTASSADRTPAAVLLDLDDTLIEEEAFARAQLRGTAALVDGLPSEGWDEVVIAAARSLWYESPFFPACTELGIASWEGLWATFAGTHARLAGLAAWAPTYRRQAWRAALRAAGHADGASLDADAMAAHYVGGAARRPSPAPRGRSTSSVGWRRRCPWRS